MDCNPQAPLSMEFSRQKQWSGLSFPPPGDFPNPRIEPASPVLVGGFIYHKATREDYLPLCILLTAMSPQDEGGFRA